MDPAGTPKAENTVEKKIRGVFPTPVTSFQRRELESGLEHRFQVHPGRKTEKKIGDKAAYRVVPSPPSKSSPLRAGVRTRTMTTAGTRST